MQKVLAAIVSVIFPPLGVLIRRGWSAHLVINVALTLCAWLPGLIHALYHCVKDEITAPDAPCRAEPVEPIS